jgi:hypothetical protein
VAWRRAVQGLGSCVTFCHRRVGNDASCRLLDQGHANCEANVRSLGALSNEAALSGTSG